jgi:hypothetical protein
MEANAMVNLPLSDTGEILLGLQPFRDPTDEDRSRLTRVAALVDAQDPVLSFTQKLSLYEDMVDREMNEELPPGYDQSFVTEPPSQGLTASRLSKWRKVDAAPKWDPITPPDSTTAVQHTLVLPPLARGPVRRLYHWWDFHPGWHRPQPSVLKYPPGSLHPPVEFFDSIWAPRGPEGSIVEHCFKSKLRLGTHGKWYGHPWLDHDLDERRLLLDILLRYFGQEFWSLPYAQKAIHEVAGGSYGMPVLASEPQGGKFSVISWADPTFQGEGHELHGLDYLERLFRYNMINIGRFKREGMLDEAQEIESFLGNLGALLACLRAVNGFSPTPAIPWYYNPSQHSTVLYAIDYHMRSKYDSLREEEEGLEKDLDRELEVLKIYLEKSLRVFYHRDNREPGGPLRPIVRYAWPDLGNPFPAEHTYWTRTALHNLSKAQAAYINESHYFEVCQGCRHNPIRAWRADIRERIHLDMGDPFLRNLNEGIPPDNPVETLFQILFKTSMRLPLKPD